ncbi:unnamed protein product [Pleuronectes platessa]|uniref:Uncharacterized protein n=1 Tax=Pleuronectes platessa TaxID=8262 RepID=A0A9N7V8Y2_PLEPL|nr:unnamed protein product [Pleuronectes platessa]
MLLSHRPSHRFLPLSLSLCLSEGRQQESEKPETVGIELQARDLQMVKTTKIYTAYDRSHHTTSSTAQNRPLYGGEWGVMEADGGPVTGVTLWGTQPVPHTPSLLSPLQSGTSGN